MLTKRALLKSTTALSFAHVAEAWSQGASGKVIRVVVPFGAGGTTDIMARLLAPELGRGLGTSLIVENKAGAGGRLGTGDVARSAPDGNTIALVADGFAVDTLIYKEMQYDPFKDLVPVTLLARVPLVLVARTNLPADDIPSLVRLARKEPGAISFGSVGVGSAQHLAGEFFAQKAGLKLIHVPYKGGSSAQSDLMAGTLDIFWGSAAFAKPALSTGRIKALGVASDKPCAAVPGVKTVAEQGFAGFELYGWTGFVLPAGTPAAVVNRWQAEIAKAMKAPEVEKRVVQLGWESIVSTPAAFGAFMRAENSKWAQTLKQTNFTMQ